MKLKRLLALLLAVLMCFVMISCKKETNSDDKKAAKSEKTEISKSATVTPLLYRVTDEKDNVIWLFGSIHVGREDYYPLPDYVQNAFEDAESLAVEVDIVEFEKDVDGQYNALSPLIYNDGTKIYNHISQSLYEKAVDILKEYGSYFSSFDYYRPVFWSSMIDSLLIEQLGGDAELGIDIHLIDAAYKAKKEVVEIESAEFQYKMLADFEEEVQIFLLKTSVRAYEKADKAAADLELMMDLWASGNEDDFEEYLNSSDPTMTEKGKQLYAKYNQIILTNRNLSMADFAEEALLSGKETFICVGAAHIVGEGAVADLLSERGYTVEIVNK